MPRCTDLGTAEHRILQALDAAGRGSKRRVARVSLTDIGQTVAFNSEKVRTGLDDLIELRFVERPAEGVYQLFIRCTCKRTDSSIHPGASSNAKGGGEGEEGRVVSLRLRAAGYTLPGAPGAGTSKKSPEQGLSSSVKGPGWGRVKNKGLNALPIQSWNGYHLAMYFQRRLAEEATAQGIDLGPCPVVLKALSRHFGMWRTSDGLPSATIRQMIDIFCDDLSRWKRQRGKSWWQTIVRYRTKLWEEARAVERTSKLSGEAWTAVTERSESVDWFA